MMAEISVEHVALSYCGVRPRFPLPSTVSPRTHLVESDAFQLLHMLVFCVFLSIDFGPRSAKWFSCLQPQVTQIQVSQFLGSFLADDSNGLIGSHLQFHGIDTHSQLVQHDKEVQQMSSAEKSCAEQENRLLSARMNDHESKLGAYSQN